MKTSKRRRIYGGKRRQQSGEGSNLRVVRMCRCTRRHLGLVFSSGITVTSLYSARIAAATNATTTAITTTSTTRAAVQDTDLTLQRDTRDHSWNPRRLIQIQESTDRSIKQSNPIPWMLSNEHEGGDHRRQQHGQRQRQRTTHLVVHVVGVVARDAVVSSEKGHFQVFNLVAREC